MPITSLNALRQYLSPKIQYDIQNNIEDITAVTQVANDSSTKLATTQFVQNNLANYYNKTTIDNEITEINNTFQSYSTIVDVSNNYVAKAGSTMTGNLTLNNSIYYKKETGKVRGTYNDANASSSIIQLTDNNNKTIGSLYNQFKMVSENDYVNQMSILVYSPTVTTATYSTLGIGYNKNGVYTVAPTPAKADNSTQIATTAFVKSNLSDYSLSGHTHDYLPLTGGTVTGKAIFTGSQIPIEINLNNSVAYYDLNVNNGKTSTRLGALRFTQGATGGTNSILIGVSDAKNSAPSGLTVSRTVGDGTTAGTVTITGVTPSADDNSTKLATTAFVKTAISNLVNSAPAALDTLGELATALGDPSNLAGSIVSELGNKIDTGITTSGSGNVVTAVTESGGKITVTKGASVSLSTHTHTSAEISDKLTKSAAGNTGWSSSASDRNKLIDMQFLSYWNGRYSDTASNLQYFKLGEFGDMATKTAANYALLASPAFTGTPTAPTAAKGTNTTQIATTAFVVENASRIVSANTTIFVSSTGTGDGTTAANAMSVADMWKYLATLKMYSSDSSYTLTIKFVPIANSGSYGNFTFDSNKMPGVRTLVIDTSTGTNSTLSNFSTNSPVFGNIYIRGSGLSSVTLKNIESTGIIAAEFSSSITLNTYVGATRFAAQYNGRMNFGNGIFNLRYANVGQPFIATEYGVMVFNTATMQINFRELCRYSSAIFISDVKGRMYVNYGRCKFTGTQPIVAISANGTLTGTSETAAGTAAKVITTGNNITLANNTVVYVKFTNHNTAANPTLNIDGTGAKAIYFNNTNIPANYLNANIQYKLTYNSSSGVWVCNNAFQRCEYATSSSYFSSSSNYNTTYNDGEWNWTDFSRSWINGANINGKIYGNVQGNLTGNADTATTATKLGTATVGGTTQVFYLNAGVPTAITNKTFASALINSLETGTDTPKDADYYVSQYVNGGTTNTEFRRRPVSALYTYMKSKFDSVYATPSSNITGTAANVTGTVAIANGGTGATTRLNALKALTNENVGTSATHFLTITDSWGKGGYSTVANVKSVLGLKSAAYTESSAYAAASHGNHVPTIETANNAKFLRNDNTWQTVTPANIGAAASSHTHSYLPLAGGTMTGTIKCVAKDLGSTFVNAAKDGGAIVSMTNTDSFGAWLTGYTKSYKVALATNPGSDEKVRLYSITKANVTAGTNTTAKTLSWDASTGRLDVDNINGYTIAASVPSGAKFTDTVYTHPTTSGNKHIPSGGSSGQFLKWSADGTAVWAADNNTVTTATTTGTGNAVTAVTASNGALTITKGATFLTSHQSLANYLTKTTNISEMGRYIDMHYDNATAKYDYDVRLQASAQGTAAGGGTLTITAALVSCSKLAGAYYADYAEYFPKGEPTEPGDVIVLDLNSEKEKYIKSSVNNKIVVGVHSDNYSHLIGGETPPEGVDFITYNEPNYIPVALCGRIATKFIGPAKKGSYVVPSEVDGVARAYDKLKDDPLTVFGILVEEDVTDDLYYVRRLMVKLK